ncbi:hypothetical protein Cob_v009446 [Colletotrichum orbiculare MAFF 240422]|uniref:Nad dependent epimerase dehydratase family protein n=1 Tax=Colletotrichum orbiculare (strain 104-T / ATCC 96160 / CBS 514.97 / LARS 414 / MAFF 240422) TaxID=1213857 RepID=A0A484FHU4_COLOR|nr:hypothetical protein Cob_v009446 [Colletotrichum orbiculare MAFF 240422]
MVQNILITGAAGYMQAPSKPSRKSYETNTLTAAVRFSPTSLDAYPILLDMGNETAVKKAILDNEIDFVIHAAGSIDPSYALNLVKALGEHGRISGRQTYFVLSSVSMLYSDLNGWPYGKVSDEEDVFEKEQSISTPDPARVTNVSVMELSEALGVTAFNIGIPFVHGRGSGEVKKLSTGIPANIRASIQHKLVHRFDNDGNIPLVHISDLVSFYGIITEKILLEEPVPSGKKGYYFVHSHFASWWSVMQRIAEAMHARGLVTHSSPVVWPDDDTAAESLGLPRQFLRAMVSSSPEITAVNPHKIGWEPQWNATKFLEAMDDEVRDVLEVGGDSNSSIFEFLLSPAEK